MRKHINLCLLFLISSITLCSNASYWNLGKKVSESGAGFFLANSASLIFKNPRTALASLGVASVCCIINAICTKNGKNIFNLNIIHPKTWHSNLSKNEFCIGMLGNILLRAAQNNGNLSYSYSWKLLGCFRQFGF